MTGVASDGAPAKEGTHGRPGRTGRQVADALREDILAARLSPGERIVQDEVAERFGVSRIPVREGLRMLEADGLVVLRSSSGAWVATMTAKDCAIAYQIRERLEPMLLAESMPRLTGAHLDRLEELQRAIEANDDVEEFLRLDRAFHWTTYEGNTVAELQRIVGRYWDVTQHYRRAFARLGGSRGWVINAEHQLLLQALRDGDVVSAQHVLVGHIQRTRVELLRRPEAFDPA
jgi:DNA-binding GntR family transcriptional regulator